MDASARYRRPRGEPKWLARPTPVVLAGAALVGAGSAFGFEPAGLWWLGLVCLGVLVRAAATDRRRAALYVLAFFAGQSALMLSWIATAFTFQSKMPAAMGWLAVVGLSVYLALFPAAAAWGAARLARGRWSFLWLFAGLFAVAEMLRGSLFTGFAWNPLGALTLDLGGVARWMALVGANGMSALVILALGALALLPGAALRRRAIAGILGALVLGVAAPEALAPAPAAGPDAPRLLLVQPGTSIEVKHGPGGTERAIRDAVAATLGGLAQAGEPVAAVIWPEATVEIPLEDAPWLARDLGSILPPGTLLLTGGIAIERDGDGRETGARNSLFALDGAGTILARYDKAHLVPGGEYLPLRAITEPMGLARLVPGSLDFLPGPGPVSWALPGLPLLAPNICYEIIFPAAVVDRRARPAAIVTVSNDSWFGRFGPPQHHAQARLRAIEEGLPIVRVTPTGITGIILADGRMGPTLERGGAATLLTGLPPALTPTPFARAGLLLPAGLALFLAAAGLWMRRRGT